MLVTACLVVIVALEGKKGKSFACVLPFLPLRLSRSLLNSFSGSSSPLLSSSSSSSSVPSSSSETQLLFIAGIDLSSTEKARTTQGLDQTNPAEFFGFWPRLLAAYFFTESLFHRRAKYS